MPLVLLSSCTIPVPCPSSPPGWHSCIARREDAEHPWSRVPTPPQLPVPLPTCLLAPVQMPREQHRTSQLPVTGKGQARCRGLCGHSPALGQLDYLFLSEQRLALATPHQHHNQPCSFSFIQDCCHQKEKTEERQSQDRFPPLPSGVIPPPCPELGSVGARRRMPAQKAPAVSLWRCPALPSPEHPTFEHEASFVSESSPKGVGLPPLF